MIKDKDGLSDTAKIFFDIAKEKLPVLLENATVQSPSEQTPLIEQPGSIVFFIPTPEGFPIASLYVETRKEDILIVLGSLTHYHYSWSSPEEIQKSILSAIQFISDILNERVLFVKRKSLLTRKEFIDLIRTEELEKKKRVLSVYSWRGTFDRTV